MNKREWVEEFSRDHEVELLVDNDLSEAIVGVCQRFNDTFVVYDREKVIEILTADAAENCDGDADPEEMAEDHFSFNYMGFWLGEVTPGFIEFPNLEDE